MSYKIVQEICSGKNKPRRLVLTIIPEAFESNGVLWFPPATWSTRKRNLIVKNPYAKPDKSKWKAKSCVLKRANITTYALAEQIEEIMLDKKSTEVEEDADSETDDEAEDVTVPRIRSEKICRSPQPDFNSLLLECQTNSSTPTDKNGIDGCTTMPVTADIISIDASTPISIVNNSISPSEYVSTIVTPNISENYTVAGLPMNVETASVNITSVWNNIIANQIIILDKIKEIENSVTTGFAKCFTEMENIVKMYDICPSSALSQAKTSNVFVIEHFEKISCLSDANHCETLLENVQYKNDMVQKLGYIVGKNGQRTNLGWNCCYELVDSFFQRSFLVECSWTGASTSKADSGKIAFLTFKNIISCFAAVIINADPQFSLEQTKSFFKQLLRNSKRFSKQELTQTRKSVKRCRTKTNINIEEKGDEDPSTETDNDGRI